MKKDLSNSPKVVRKLDGALTEWRWFHSPGFERSVRLRRKAHRCSLGRSGLSPEKIRALADDETTALFTVLVSFVAWMQAPITPMANNLPAEV